MLSTHVPAASPARPSFVAEVTLRVRASNADISELQNQRKNCVDELDMELKLLMLCALMAPVYGDNFTIGYLGPIDGRRVRGSAINIAIEAFKANGWLEEHKFK